MKSSHCVYFLTCQFYYYMESLTVIFGCVFLMLLIFTGEFIKDGKNVKKTNAIVSIWHSSSYLGVSNCSPTYPELGSQHKPKLHLNL